MNWNTIERLITLSQRPLDDPWLEALQVQFHDPQVYYRFLYHLLLVRQPKLALEIGTYHGVGSAHLAAAAASYGGQVIGIDLNEHGTTRDSIPERYSNYHFIHGDSTQSEIIQQVRSLVERFGPIGVVYQDSSHHYEASWKEWEAYSQMLDSLAHRPAVWVCDDITPAFHDKNIDPPGKGMVQYFEGLPGQKRLYPDVLHRGNSIGVVLI